MVNALLDGEGACSRSSQRRNADKDNVIKNLAFIITAAIGLITTYHTQARLEWTLDDCKQQYGQPLIEPVPDADGRMAAVFSCFFQTKGYFILTLFRNDRVSRIWYTKTESSFDPETVGHFLSSNAPGAVWSRRYRDKQDITISRWDGIKEGKPAYFASLDQKGTLRIWTKEDIDATNANRRKAKDTGLRRPR